jgi:hypothetical protein
MVIFIFIFEFKRLNMERHPWSPKAPPEAGKQLGGIMADWKSKKRRQVAGVP